MIDIHVHLRDWNQWRKETVYHGIQTAHKAGLDAIFEQPNTSPALTSRNTIEARLKLAASAIQALDITFFHGLYGGITADPKQIEEVIDTYNDHERVVGLKLFAGQSTGNMGLIEKEEQEQVYQALANNGYEGVIVVHCEKEALMQPHLFNHQKPITHTIARPPEAEVASVEDQIELAEKAGFKGTLHIAHLSVPEAYRVVENAKENVGFKITTEATPHHLILYDQMMNDYGHLQKMNPPLRSRALQQGMFDLLMQGKIDVLATDHAPHKLKDKQGTSPASGVPGLPFYPEFVGYLQEEGMSAAMLEDITHNNAMQIFCIAPEHIPNTRGANTTNKTGALAEEYEFNAFQIFYE